MTTLYEHGTLAALMAGNFDGTITVGDLLKHGSMGIGTFTGLDGEVVILNNEVYQAVSSGQVNHITDMDATMPFASVHFPAEQQDITLRNVNRQPNNDFVKEHQLANVFAFLQLRVSLSSKFDCFTRKAIPDFTRCCATQFEFAADNIAGQSSATMRQKSLNNNGSGWHLHFT